MSSIIKSPFINYASNNKKIIGENNKNNINDNNEEDIHTSVAKINKSIEKQKKQAEQVANDIINKAMGDAQSIVEEAKRSAIDITEEAYKKALEDGYKDGINKGEQEAIRLKNEADQILQQAYDKKEEIISDIEPKMVNILIELVKNLTDYVIEKEEIIIYLIKKGFSEIETLDDLIVHISPDDFDYVNDNNDKLCEEISQTVNVEIIKDNTLESNECFIETKLGNLDCSFNTRLSGLTSDLKLIANSLNS
ncbi:FliH/SctL family protein [Vallitalea sp.]|uniref:FliH/SctL family protein n=1 Tax=Vallitalea sp. TaxID=1882829 RepID=UPI0025D42F51|nr:FliH/SctL family protein [Vallitalea sp.]MCT4688223.1 FliH/SctL family protein [Vallitalea sp.]